MSNPAASDIGCGWLARPFAANGNTCPETTTFDTLDAAKQRCLEVGRACDGAGVQDSKLAGNPGKQVGNPR